MLKKIIKILRKKSAQKHKKSAGYNKKITRILRGVIGMVIGAIALIFVLNVVGQRKYHSYEVLINSEQEDIISTKYEEIDGGILRYGLNEVSMLTESLDVIWNEIYSMNNPIASVKQDKAVIADVDGTAMEIYDINGRTGSVVTPYTIIKAEISSSGMAAVIMDDGEDTWINLYSPEGTLIAEMQTKINDPGYPLDIALSDDGTVLMVTYQFISGNNTTSYVAFYNFGEAGQNEDSRIVSGYTYENVIIPQIEYLEKEQAVALKDNGFSIYKGKEVPVQQMELEAEDEIVSTFCDDNTIGVVYKNENKEKQSRMEVYNASGKKKFVKEFNIPYTTIKISGEAVIMYNSSQICIVDQNGKDKFMGEVDGNIKNLLKICWNRYLLVLYSGVNVIKLK